MKKYGVVSSIHVVVCQTKAKKIKLTIDSGAAAVVTNCVVALTSFPMVLLVVVEVMRDGDVVVQVNVESLLTKILYVVDA